MKKALITGVAGQDGSYLSELLLQKGYEVHGVIRPVSMPHVPRIAHVADRLHLHPIDLQDGYSLQQLIAELKPDEVYHLGAQSNVKVSFELPELTTAITGLATQYLLEGIRKYSPKTRFYQASSSELFGKVREVPQKETTPFHPRSPYGCAKAFAHFFTVNYREAYGIHASCGILFNHESPRRGESFVTRKITCALAKIVAGKANSITLGNLDSKRDWGYTQDYVEAMWLMLQQAKPDDYVIATGETHSIQEFLSEAFELVGLDWKKYVKSDAAHFRPSEVDLLVGDASKAKKVLGWQPKVGFKELVRIMVESDLKAEGIDLQRLPDKKKTEKKAA